MDKVWLRALEPDDYKFTHQWRLDEATWSAVAGTKGFVSRDTERRWLMSALESHEKGIVLRFVVCVGDSEEPVGLVSATSVNHINKSCELGSLLSPEYRGKGIIQKAWLKVYDHLFSQLGMNRVECFILADNLASRRSHEKFGLVKEGIHRQAVYKDGSYKDLVVYAMLKSEFYPLYSDSVKKPDAT